MSPLVLIVGRMAGDAKGVRGEPFAAGRRYFHAVANAGGTPLMLPPILSLVDDVPDLLRRVDAIVLHGGGDVDPRHYGQEPSAEQLYGIVEEHDEVELAVVRAALEQDVPMLAICRGMQVLNVALGGTLQQHIGTEDHWMEYTQVSLDHGSLVAEAMGTTHPDACHCVHHQALDVVAPELEVTGRTADGIVHAADLRGARWCVATQWHPEDSADGDPQQQRLFAALLAHA
ncbi:MAG: gamma-glutamyl-gamma-aminobutyrate hydrolase family protein [Ilumatobacteraceae bacterium]